MAMSYAEAKAMQKTSEECRRTLGIANKRGLHARAAAKFVRTAGQFDAAVRVGFKGQEVSGLSIMGLMMLSAGIGSEVELTCSGRQAADAMTALSALVEGKFGED